MTSPIVETSTDVLQRIDALRRQRGDALADGKSTDAINSKIALAEIALEACQDREAALARRARQQDHRESDANRKAFEKQLANCKHDIACAAGEAQRAAETLARKLSIIESLYEKARQARHNLGIQSNANWAASSISERYGYMLSRVFSNMRGHPASMGGVHWQVHGAYPSGQNWRQSEERALADKSPTVSTQVQSKKRKSANG